MTAAARRPGSGWRAAAALAALLLAAAAAAQPAYRVLHLDEADGLRDDQFNAFFGTDSRGYHWIGASDGAFRYDGQRVRHYPIDRGEQIQRLVQSDFHEDRAGDVWFTLTDALVRYDHEADRMRRTRLSIGDSTGGMGLYLFGYDSTAHAAWIATSEAIYGVDLARPDRPTRAAASRAVRVLELERTDGSVWRGLGLPWLLRPGVERLTLRRGGPSTRELTTDSLLARTVVSDGAVDAAGGVWLASDRGLVAYDVARDSTVGVFPAPGHGEADPKVWHVRAVDSLLLVSTDRGGLWWFDPQTARFAEPFRATVSSERPCDQARTLHVAPDGVILAMCRGGGADVLLPVPVDVRVPRGPDGAPILAVELAPRRGGGVWALEADGKLHAIDREGHREWSEPVGGPRTRNRLRWLTTDASGTVYVADGERVWANGSGRRGDWSEQADYPEAPLGIYAVGGVDTPPEFYVLTPDSLYCSVQGQPPLSVKGWTGGVAGSAGVLQELFPLEGGTFGHVRGDGTLTILQLQNCEAEITDRIEVGAEVFSVAGAARDGSLLIGTPQGLLHATRDLTERWRVRSHTNGGVSVEGIAVQDDRVWLATNRGIHAVDSVGDVRLWTDADGLPSRQSVLGGVPVLNGERIFVPTVAGVASWRTLESARDSASAKLLLQEVWLGGRPTGNASAGPRDPVRVPYDVAGIEVAFTSVRLYGEDAGSLEYRVLPDNPRWQSARLARPISLGQLRPGEHVVEAVFEQVDGRTSLPVRVHLHVSPPIWQQWWFWLAVLAGISLVTALAVRRAYQQTLARERQAREREAAVAAERSRIARGLHDQLGTTLSNILFLSEDTEAQRGLDEDSAIRIRQLSRQGMNNLRETVLMLDNRSERVSLLLARIGENARALCTDRRVDCRVVAPRPGVKFIAEANSDLRRGLYLLANEAIGNALKHSGASELTVDFHGSTATRILLVVEDDGDGFDVAAAAGRGVGLASMRERATGLGGRIEFASSPGRGTCVTVEIPIVSP